MSIKYLGSTNNTFTLLLMVSAYIQSLYKQDKCIIHFAIIHFCIKICIKYPLFSLKSPSQNIIIGTVWLDDDGINC